MTTFNTDYNTTELLDQELTIEQLEAVAGGNAVGQYFETFGLVFWAIGEGTKKAFEAIPRIRITAAKWR